MMATEGEIANRKAVLATLARDGSWWAFYHGLNIAAAHLHAGGAIDRRRWDRPLGGYEYRQFPPILKGEGE